MSAQLMEWRVAEGLLEGFDPDTLEHRATITRTADGQWLLVIHGVATNDEGNPYQWSRQELVDDVPVLLGSVGEARARAEVLGPQFVAEHVDVPEPHPNDQPEEPAAE